MGSFMDADKLVICSEEDFDQHRNALDLVNFDKLDDLMDDDHLVIPTGKPFWEAMNLGVIHLAQKKKWMFARGSMAPPLVLFEDCGNWRKATPVLGAVGRSCQVDFKVSTQSRAGFHLSREIPCVDIADNQRLVFLKYYGPNFGLRYVGAMFVGCLQDVNKGYKGISAAMQERFNVPLPDNVDYFRLLGPETVERIDVDATVEEGKQAPVPEHGEIIVIQSSTVDADCCFSKKFRTFPRFSEPAPEIPRALTFGEQLFEDAEKGFLADTKFIGGSNDNKYTVMAHRMALCTVAYFRQLFTKGVKEGHSPPTPDQDGYYLITPPAFADHRTMKHFIRWIYSRTLPKEVKHDVSLCLNLIRLGEYCVCDDLVHACVNVIGGVKSFTIPTALDALDLAQKLGEAEAAILKRRTMQYIVMNFEQVAATERFHKMVGTAVYYQIIAAVYQWSVYYAQLASQQKKA